MDKIRMLFVRMGNICRSPTGEGEAELSRMHLTCIRAAERPATEGRAGVHGFRKHRAREGM